MKVIIETVVSAPVDEVWDAWTTLDVIKDWNSASRDWHCPTATIDLNPGPEFSYRMEARDGSMGFDFSGAFTWVVPPESIEYSLSDGRSVSVDFIEIEGRVVVRERFEVESDHSGELQRQGWRAILDSFARHVEAKGM